MTDKKRKTKNKPFNKKYWEKYYISSGNDLKPVDENGKEIKKQYVDF